jgi:hypothetical protein
MFYSDTFVVSCNCLFPFSYLSFGIVFFIHNLEENPLDESSHILYKIYMHFERMHVFCVFTEKKPNI